MHANFQKIMNEFQQEGFVEDSYMRESDLMRVLDRCAKTNAKVQKFDREIFQELWQNTLKNEAGDCVMLKDYIETLCEAQDILKEKIRITQDKYSAQINEHKKREFMVAIYSMSQDEKAITAPFKISDELPSKLIQLSRHNISQLDKTSTSIFADEVNLQYKTSFGLTIVAYLTALALLMDIITVMAHYNFYGLLVLLFVASIFLLNYFDRVYIRFLFFNLIISMILDAIWLAMKFDNYWRPQEQSTDLKFHPAFLKFVIISTFIIGSCKLIITIILFKHRGNPHGLRKKAIFLILSFNLDANPLRNPITPVIQKTFPKFIIS